MVSKERHGSPRRVSSGQKKQVDSHGFPTEKSGGDLFSGIPNYTHGADQENFDDISWDDGTITTLGTTSKPSRPKLMPINRESFCVGDNPFGYGDGGPARFCDDDDHTPSRHMRSRRASVSGSIHTSSNKRNDRRRGDENYEAHPEEGTSRHSRYRRRSSVSGSVDNSNSRGDHRPRRSRRSSTSHVSQDAPPLFTGDDILSSTTIDQGNGNRVCVVVVQLDNNGNPMDDNVLKRGSDHQDSDRKSSDRSRRRSSYKDTDHLESAGNTLNGRDSRRSVDSERRSSEVRSGDRPTRRRSMCSIDDSKEPSRSRRSTLKQGKSMRERDEHRGESHAPRRRSSITHADSNFAAEQKGSKTEQSLRKRCSIERTGSNLSGSRASSDRQDGSTSDGGDGESSRHERKSSKRSSSRNQVQEDKPRQNSDSKPRKPGERDSFETKPKSRSSAKKESRQKHRDST